MQKVMSFFKIGRVDNYFWASPEILFFLNRQLPPPGSDTPHRWKGVVIVTRVEASCTPPPPPCRNSSETTAEMLRPGALLIGRLVPKAVATPEAGNSMHRLGLWGLG